MRVREPQIKKGKKTKRKKRKKKKEKSKLLLLSKFLAWHSGSVLYFVFTRTLFSPYTNFPWQAVSLQVTDDPTRFDISNPKWNLPPKKKIQSGKIYALNNVVRTKKVLKIKSTKAITQVSNVINPIRLAKFEFHCQQFFVCKYL